MQVNNVNEAATEMWEIGKELIYQLTKAECLYFSTHLKCTNGISIGERGHELIEMRNRLDTLHDYIMKGAK